MLKYSSLSLRFVVGLALGIYSVTQFRTGSYTLAAFSGMDLPEKIKSPVNGFSSTCGVLAEGSIIKL